MSEQLNPFGITSGRISTIDDDIAFMEDMIDRYRVVEMASVVLEKIGPGITKVHVASLGTPLPLLREMFKVAIGAINDMIGEE